MNEPAFPTPLFFNEIQVDCTAGLTKREFFAAMALAGLLANGNKEGGQQLAHMATFAADQLLKELQRSEAQ